MDVFLQCEKRFLVCINTEYGIDAVNGMCASNFTVDELCFINHIFKIDFFRGINDEIYCEFS